MTRPIEQEARPRPLRTVAQKVAAGAAIAGAALSSAAGVGVLTFEQNDALQAALAGGVGLFTAVTAVMAAFGVARRGEPLVTPVSDPQDDAGRALRPSSPPGDFGSGIR